MIDKPAGDAQPVGAIVFMDGIDEHGVLGRVGLLPEGGHEWLPTGEIVPGLAEIPAVVAAFFNEIHLLIEILANISEVEKPGLGIYRGTPGIAEAVGPDLGSGVRSLKERVV